ncbi:TetR family transcriptional regulator [Burkholderia sp. WAC0059]|uniref:TetR/AcrR family transcriptional regulator n=1 Tax=Burkholderia sp. WAC0059 TaxID=2066022 RepID=UPI000C7EE057|nr:TetR/AcrR family transcriptional regulator [Burkholderia sp. WAC0059]PLZ03053.1 TetR family transcriptional regulator [Burkholderia sp. WAC0059]
MRKSREEASKTRVRIVGAASERLRRCGLEATSLADVMRDAGLTHGGFYRHFESREQLIGEAYADMLTAVVDALVQRLAEIPAEQRLRAFIELYLSPGHLEDRACGCGFAAVGSELARQAPALRSKATGGFRHFVEALVNLQTQGDAAEKRARAQFVAGALTGAMTLARTVDDAALADEILANTRTCLVAAL